MYFDQDLTSEAGEGCLSFDFPEDTETFVVDGSGSKDIYKKGGLWGQCSFEFQGGLRTQVQKAHEEMSDKKIFRLRKKRRISDGTSPGASREERLVWPTSQKMARYSLFKCESNWRARWIDELPEPRE